MRTAQFLYRFSFIVETWILIGTICFGQSGGRFEEAKRRAIEYLDSGEYDRAAGKLEEVWEQDPSDPFVAENLAIAYLNGDDRRQHPELEKRAAALMNEAIRLNGQATFLVQHSHERFGFLQGRTINNYCTGKLMIRPGKLVFVAQARRGSENHSFELTPDEVRFTGPNPADQLGAMQIKTASKTYSIVTRSRKIEDSRLIKVIAVSHLGL